jgi:hypothetical protein
VIASVTPGILEPKKLASDSDAGHSHRGQIAYRLGRARGVWGLRPHAEVGSNVRTAAVASVWWLLWFGFCALDAFPKSLKNALR